MLQTLIQNKVNLDLKQAIAAAAEIQPIDVESEQCNEAHDFVVKRLEQLLIEDDAPREVIRSVLAERNSDPYLAVVTVKELAELYTTEDFAAVLASYSRPTRIVSGKDVDMEWKVD